MSHSPPNPQWSSDYFRESQTESPQAPVERGMVGHVPIVATLMIVLGAIEGSFGAASLLFSLIALTIPAETGTDSHFLAVLFAMVSIPAIAVSLLRIAAGIYNLRFRRRKFGMTALVIGLILVFTGYCAPTAIGLAVYGLLVYLNESVVAAFELGDQGRSPQEISAAFPPRG